MKDHKKEKESQKNKRGKGETAVTPPPNTASDKHSIPVVGIGASAGGLEAFEHFFINMPSNSGIAFVLVQHLDPTHQSILVDLVQRYTQMNVVQIEDGVLVRPNTVYVIPPNQDISLKYGRLHLHKPTSPRGIRLAIDFFFRSLAEARGDEAIIIILSGTGTDGTLGLKAVKGGGGMVMVQEPETAKYDGMPRSAITTGLVDYTLPPDRMPQQLIDFVNRVITPEQSHPQTAVLQKEADLQKIFALMRQQTGHDFSQYKRNTVARRIERRMVNNQIERVEDYVRYLRQNPLEVEQLFREMLISVTRFFRDDEAFALLKEQVIPALFADRDPVDPIRVWVPGCATGEEAFSIAMLLQEEIELRKRPFQYQIFATDIDENALIAARRALYPPTIAGDMSLERFQRFFIKAKEFHQVRKEIRENILFAKQNVIGDPHFSKLDLISCRNLLIYLDSDLQQRVIPLFHYALNPGGYLFLGSSESLGKFERYFRTIDRKWKLFQRQGEETAVSSVLEFPVPKPLDRLMSVAETEKPLEDLRPVVQDLLLNSYTPACVVVNEKGNALYIHGHTGRYLELGTGQISTHIMKLVRNGLEMYVSNGLRRATAEHETVVFDQIHLNDKSQEAIKLSVQPLPPRDKGARLFALLFESVPASVNRGQSPDTHNSEYVRELEQELQSTKQYLQTTIEELRSANEELQSTNEELQSTNEELEVSQEELQSVNEELLTVNAELKAKIDELTRANNDISNLMDSLEVGAIFLDLELDIRRFTPAALNIVNLIDTDVGRPLSHTVSNLRGVNLTQGAQKVLDTLEVVQREVQTQEEKWYWMQIRPYRTAENEVDGVAMTFTDIEAQKLVQKQRDLLLKLTGAITNSRTLDEAIQKTLDLICEETHWTVAESWLPDKVGDYLKPTSISHLKDPDNKAYKAFWQASQNFTFGPNEGLQGRVWTTQAGEWWPDISAVSSDKYRRLDEIRQTGLKAALAVPIIGSERVLATLIFYDKKVHEEDETEERLVADVATQLGAVLERKQAEEALKQNEQLLQGIFDGTDVAMYLLAVEKGEHYRVVRANVAVEKLTGRTVASVEGRRLVEFEPPIAQEALQALKVAYGQCVLTGEAVPYDIMVPANEGEPTRWVGRYEPLADEKGKVDRILIIGMPIKPEEVD